MGNVLKILKRDILRLFKAPAALVVVIALLFLPSVYTWYNVVGFWDPYGNTGNVKVAVVNEDEGTSSELTGDINVGNSVVKALEENKKLDWTIVTYEQALGMLESGDAYAVIIIPESFSADLLTITTANFKQPTLQYYVNEKAGPVAPKITDTGSTILEHTVNSTFVSVVSDVAFAELGDTLVDVKSESGQAASSAVSQLSEVQTDLESARASLASVQQNLTSIQSDISSAQSSLNNAKSHASAAKTEIEEIVGTVEAATNSLNGISTDTLSAVSQSITTLSALLPKASELGYGEQVQSAIDSLTAAQSTLYGQSVPAITSSLTKLSETDASLSSSVTGATSSFDAAQTLLTDLSSTLGTAKDAISQTDELLAGLSDDIGQVKSDLVIISRASSDDASTLSQVSTDDLAQFVSAPTQLVTEQLYELNAYGSAMAPLFMNLTFWIGAFMLLVVMRQEVDGKGIRRLKAWQRYLGRFLLFAIFAVLQAVICCIGVLALGVQAANAAALFAASAVCSLTYLSIIYALSVLFQHVGKGLCVILVFVQIPAATGLYPVEMTAQFYQAIYPLFPFTYGINIMREAICGFYGMNYAFYLFVLLAFLVGFMVLGLALRRPLASFTRMFTEQVEASGMFNGERVVLPHRRMQTFVPAHNEANETDADEGEVLTEEEYHEILLGRYRTFSRLYPRLVRLTLLIGVAAPLIISVCLTLTNSEKAALLTVWLIWVVIIIAALVVIETLRYWFERDMGLSSETAEAEAEATDGEAETDEEEAEDETEEPEVAPRPVKHRIAVIFKNDMKHLCTNVISIILVAGLVVLPSFFTWYNVLASWDVFGNTGNVKVAVASVDEGYKSDLIPVEINVGDTLLSELRANKRIDWVITDEEDAIDGARAGRYYAAIVIPETFSNDLLTFYMDDAEQASIIYYANQKLSAIAPRVTDVGASTISSTVNTVFAETLTSAAVEILQSISAIADEEGIATYAAQVPAQLRTCATRIDQGRQAFSLFGQTLGSTSSLLSGSGAVLKSAGDTATQALADASSDISSATEGAQVIAQSATTISDALADAQTNLESLIAILEQAKAEGADVDELLAQANEAHDAVVARKADFDSNVKPRMEALPGNVSALAGSVNGLSGDVSSLSSSINDIVSNVNSILSSVTSSINTAASKMQSTSDALNALADEIDQAVASGDDSALAQLLSGDATTLASSLTSPVAVERTALYPAENFGSAMTPMYAALALFIGTLLIMVLIKRRVSDKALADLPPADYKPRHFFLGRYCTIAVLALAQATVMGVGDIVFVGVQVEQPLMLMLAFWVAALVFSFIGYTLVYSFANLGKAVLVLVLIIQVTGCGGSYPLSVLPDFISNLSPFLPATHVVNAMREAMFGLYGMNFWIDLGILLLFTVPFILLGLVIHKPFDKFMDWYLEKVEESGLMA